MSTCYVIQEWWPHTRDDATPGHWQDSHSFENEKDAAKAFHGLLDYMKIGRGNLPRYRQITDKPSQGSTMIRVVRRTDEEIEVP